MPCEIGFLDSGAVPDSSTNNHYGADIVSTMAERLARESGMAAAKGRKKMNANDNVPSRKLMVA